ncbi:MAG: GTP-binding protein [Candidatus Hermodarchaeota archaeon]
MPKFTVEEAVELMKDREHVRNLGIIAHIDHGKSSLTDSLLSASGLLAESIAGQARATDTREDEQERGITIKTTGISLFHEIAGEEFIINLQDTPGHVDFSGEVTSALRVVDGALVVVDAVEGVMVQTEVVTRQALAERVRPVLMINKVDRLITEMAMKPEDAYERFKRIIADFNQLIELYARPEYKKWKVDPREGTVAFGSATMRFGLTIPSLAKVWAEKTGKPAESLINLLWQKKNFVDGVLKPTYEIYNSADKGDKDHLKKVCKKIDITLSEKDWLEPPKMLAKRILEEWMPVEVAVLDMVCKFCPSPLEAQKYRISATWKGDLDSPMGKAMLECDENGPLMICLSKMIPGRAKQIIAMGRIFSGKIKQGQRVKAILPGYNPERPKEKSFVTNVQQVTILMGKDTKRVEEIPAGNIVALYGLKGAFASSTIYSGKEIDSGQILPFDVLTYAVEPVVTIALEPKTALDLPKLGEGMSLIALVDPSLKPTINEETGEYLLAGTGELHLEIAVKDLQDLQRIEVTQSKPIVMFRESVAEESSYQALAKSPNKHNRLWFKAEPLSPSVIKAIEAGEIHQYTDRKELSRTLRDEHGWSKDEARKVWGFGPEENDPNLLVDQTKGVQYLREVREYIIQGFRWAAREGPLCREPFYGVKFSLHDCRLHEDPVHRGVAQVMPVARRASYGSFLLAKPILLEPIYKINVTVPERFMGNVVKVITRRRGTILDTKTREGTPLTVIEGEVPVAESFGMTAELRAETSGFAFTQQIFSRWEKVPGNPMKPEEEGGGLARKYVMETRERKGMHQKEPPTPDEYIDKL